MNMLQAAAIVIVLTIFGAPMVFACLTTITRLVSLSL